MVADVGTVDGSRACPRCCLDGGCGPVEVEVALAVEDPGGDELEPVGDVLVVVEELANVGVRGQAGGVAATTGGMVRPAISP